MSETATSTASALHIRPATVEDLPAVLALYAQPEIDNGNILSPAEARPIFERFATYPNYRLYVACEGAQVVGTFSLLIVENLAHRGAPSGVVEDVVVAVTHQHRGIGKQMMRFALDRCRESGCYKMALSANQRRTAAHRFYESLGFERHGYSFVIDLTGPRSRDVFLAPHGQAVSLPEKRTRLGAESNPFIDPVGYRAAIDRAERDIRRRLEAATPTARP